MAHDQDRTALLWEEYAPRIAAARKRDNEGKDGAFLAYDEDRIGEFPAVLLTPKRYLLLSGVGAFGGAEAESMMVLRFLWIVSPDFKPSRISAKLFLWKHRKTDPVELLPEIQKYMARTFSNMPGSKSQGEGSAWVASMVDLLASEYGWTEKAILDCPLQHIFQYVSMIKARATRQPIEFSSEADRLQAEFMEKANAPEAN